jgi:hypothetical protein
LQRLSCLFSSLASSLAALSAVLLPQARTSSEVRFASLRGRPVYQHKPVDVRTSRQAVDACLRILASFFRKKSENKVKYAEISTKKWRLSQKLIPIGQIDAARLNYSAFP